LTNISEDSRCKNSGSKEIKERDSCILPSFQSIHLNGNQEDNNTLDKKSI